MCRRVYTHKCKLGYQRDSCFYVSNTYRHWVLRINVYIEIFYSTHLWFIQPLAKCIHDLVVAAAVPVSFTAVDTPTWATFSLFTLIHTVVS